MICAFCGLETGQATAHETQEACIDALRAQVVELKNVLQHSRRPDEPLEIPERASVARSEPPHRP